MLLLVMVSFDATECMFVNDCCYNLMYMSQDVLSFLLINLFDVFYLFIAPTIWLMLLVHVSFQSQLNTGNNFHQSYMMRE